MNVTFTGVQINIDAPDAKAAYALFCELLGHRDDVDWQTENGQFETSAGQSGDMTELWNRGEPQAIIDTSGMEVFDLIALSDVQEGDVMIDDKDNMLGVVVMNDSTKLQENISAISYAMAIITDQNGLLFIEQHEGTMGHIECVRFYVHAAEQFTIIEAEVERDLTGGSEAAFDWYLAIDAYVEAIVEKNDMPLDADLHRMAREAITANFDTSVIS